MRFNLFVPLLGAVLGVAPIAAASARSGGYSLELVDESGNRLPTFQQSGRTYVLGEQGRRYSLHLRNNTSRRVEFVAAVDGRDVLDGDPSALTKRGYIVNPYGDVVIDGFRLNEQEVAAFRFSTVQASYASRMGDARDVGVIGVAVFTEMQHYLPPPPPPRRAYDGYGYGHGRGALQDKSLGSSAEAEPMLNQFGGDSALQGAPETSAAPAPAAPEASRAKKSEQRPGLGTEFGERRDSQVYATEFERASSSPAAMLTIRYDNRGGLTAMGVNLDPPRDYEAHLRQTAEPFRRDPGYSQPPAGWND